MSKQNGDKKQGLLSKVLYCVVVLAIILVANYVSQSGSNDYLEDTTTVTTIAQETQSVLQDSLEAEEQEYYTDDEEPIEETQDPQADYLTYTFRNDDLLNSHYQKHGVEMGFASPEDYLASANAVINDPNALHKLEAEDNDEVYYLEDTQEFVVVSTDGYIRTYYYASLDYYNRQ